MANMTTISAESAQLFGPRPCPLEPIAHDIRTVLNLMEDMSMETHLVAITLYF